MPNEILSKDNIASSNRQNWLLRRRQMEATSEGNSWRGHLRSWLYRSAWHSHNVLRPTWPFRQGAKRAMSLQLTELELSFPDLPFNFDGYRILHLTDLHLDNIDDTADVAAGIIRNIDNDLCVITGDIRDNIHAPLKPLMDRLETIVSASKSPDGIMAVLGNHDTALMVEPMESLGIRVLVNECAKLFRGEEVLHFTGLDDVHRFHTEVADMTLAAAPEAFCVALVHSSEVAHLAAERHRLYLTGHTHGGQVCLPGGIAFTNSLKRNRNLSRGLWRYGKMVGYTNRGIGACIVPFRSYCPGEIMLVTLRQGPERSRLKTSFSIELMSTQS